ncbi:Glycosyltransferase IroB [Enterobacter cancerogenus]|uniref:Glycosyltransferase IroB n=1 Tax=Enterobacter cancerogenus TaxID=69218 RepID=A0A484ZAA0_9ENTR|nr:Glycosyltransferase IroB [Enterobacter cancerogenus]
MRILFVGPPLYGLLYPVLSLAQAFRVNGHEVLIASGGKFAQKAAEAGLVVFDAAPGFDSEADYRRREAQRKESNIGTKMGNFSFFSEEMADHLVEFAGTLAARSHHLPAARRHRASDCRQIRYTGRNANRRLRPYALAYQRRNAFARGRLSSPRRCGRTARYGLDRRNTTEHEHS